MSISLKEIIWPIYPINSKADISIDNGTLMIRNLTQEFPTVLDPKLLDYSSLGLRRLHYSINRTPLEPKLYRLNKPIYRYVDIFQVIDYTNKFIDSSGKLFTYHRERYVPLEYFSIKKFVEIDSGFLVYVKGIHTPFYINREPTLEEKFAGILLIGKGYALYSLTEELQKRTRRLI